MNSVLFAGMSYSLRDFNIDELKVLSLLEFVSWTQKIDYDVRILDHSLNLVLVLIVHVVIDPGTIYIDLKILFGPVVLNYLMFSE